MQTSKLVSSLKDKWYVLPLGFHPGVSDGTQVFAFLTEVLPLLLITQDHIV